MTAVEGLQLTKNILTRDSIYFGLPCIWDNVNEKYIIFSPYALKVARISKPEIAIPIVKEKLEKEGFFGIPSKAEDNNKILKFALIITTNCNLRCDYCYSYPNSTHLDMTVEYALRIIKEKIRSDTERVYITFYGGEPTLNMETIKAVVSHLEKMDKIVYFLIVTNGTSSDEDIDYLINKGFKFIVSSDGTPDITNNQRHVAKDMLLSKHIEKTILNLVQNGVTFQVRATLTSRNLNSLKEGFSYWASLGVKFVHFEPVSLSKESIRKNSNHYPNPEEYVENVILALDEAEKLGIYVISSPYMNLLTPSTHFCTTVAMEKELYAPDGAISACYQVQGRKHPLQAFLIGEYDKDSDSFIYYEDRKKKLKNIKVADDEPCSSCFAKYICAGGCPLRNKRETGDMKGIDDWMCFVKKILIHDAILRIDRAISKRQVPIVFGESIFENLVANNPSIKEVNKYAYK